MTQPLNFTPKAIEGLSNIPWVGMPGCAAAAAYIVGKLRQAEVFVLGDHGELLDRSKPRPEVPGLMFRPPFPVVALEYTAQAVRRSDPYYTAARSSRRIALAWEWADDLPSGFGKLPYLGAGVAVASIAFIDGAQTWMPMTGIMHMPYDGQWMPGDSFASPFRDAMIASGSYRGNPATERSFTISPIPLLYEVCVRSEQLLGSPAAVLDTLQADVADELNAYLDLCYALACKNVSTREYPAPASLNRQRAKSGKPPLRGFHVLELASAGEMPGGGASDRNGPRSHLRRGHIRRLAADSLSATAPQLRARALDVIERSNGLTADEVAGRLGLSILSIRPRVTELSRLGKVRDSGARRTNVSGKKAIVWAPVNPARLKGQRI